jgi:SWI/SNF-related matrix-associated actin-dependent regulator 1 of chromatin subfamily A
MAMTAFQIPKLDELSKIPPGLLYPHQADGVAFLLSKKRVVLADDMGLGKTRQAIVAMNVGAPEGTILVVCPASLKLNWRREIRMVDPDAVVEVIGAKDGAPERTPRWVIVNYDLLTKNAARLHDIPWAGVILDEAHFIKNPSQRTSHCLKLLGVQKEARAPVIGPGYVFLLTGTPMTNRPRDLFNLLRCVGHPSARSFLSFAKRYCDAYKNDFGWVTTGASNLEELNLLLKEVSIRRKKEEVLDLPPKVRTWVPVDVSGSPGALNSSIDFVRWYAATDPANPNDKQFLAKLMKVRTALHKAKHKAVEERIGDVLATGQKVIVFTSFTEGLKRHAKTFGPACVTISGSDNAEERQAAVERFQDDPEVRVAVCNLIAGGVGITLTAGTHVIFQDLDWVPANHAQAEDRCYRMGQKNRVTVEYFFAAGSLDEYISELLSLKMALIGSVEAEVAPDSSFLAELEARLRAIAPALMQETRLANSDPKDRLAELTALLPKAQQEQDESDNPGSWEFKSSRDSSKSYRVTYGRAGHLECNCEGFLYRGNCKHVQEVRSKL